MKAVLATPVEQTGYAATAANWFHRQNPGQMFTDNPSAAMLVVMEFLANAEGKTTYSHAVGKEIAP